MKKTILNFYLFLNGFIGTLFAVFHLIFILNLNNFFTSTLEKIDSLNGTYKEITKFEYSYFGNQNKQKLFYIESRYVDLGKKNYEINKTLKNRELQFLLNEINEAIFKHQETFLRSTVYLKDMKESEDEDLYNIELFNFEKSKILSENQKKTFDKKLEKFNEKLEEYYKYEKNKREKTSITIYLLIVFIATISLKYIFIWGESYGHNNDIKKNKDKKN